VGGLPHNLSDEEFRQYFIQYGEIEDCAILKDKRTGKPRGFGFVTYKSIACVEHVMSLKDTHTIQSKWVDCKRAVPAGQIIKDPTNPAN
jgi:RNA recognition motif-containing protein